MLAAAPGIDTGDTAWMLVATALVLTLGTLAIIRWQKQKPISLRGAVVIQDPAESGFPDQDFKPKQ